MHGIDSFVARELTGGGSGGRGGAGRAGGGGGSGRGRRAGGRVGGAGDLELLRLGEDALVGADFADEVDLETSAVGDAGEALDVVAAGRGVDGAGDLDVDRGVHGHVDQEDGEAAGVGRHALPGDGGVLREVDLVVLGGGGDLDGGGAGNEGRDNRVLGEEHVDQVVLEADSRVW